MYLGCRLRHWAYFQTAHTPKGAVGRLMGEKVGIGQFVSFSFQPVATVRPGSYWPTFLYKYRHLGVENGIKFLRENSAKIVTERKREREKKAGQTETVGGGDRTPTRSWSVGRGEHSVMATRGKEKDLEKGLSTPERTPKDRTRTVARPRNREDLAVDGCVGYGIVLYYDL
ncbi:hypothetical protein YC2023_066244 [Brassica napus]